MSTTPTPRYRSVAILLHWLIAAAIIAMIPLGWWMTSHVTDPAYVEQSFKAYQLHKSVGLTILVLSVLRLLWRLTHRPPALPTGMPGWERAAARVTHVLFYLIMIAMPLTGWLYVSTGWNTLINAPFEVPTLWFGLFEWPHLPGLAEASEAFRAWAAETSMTAHSILAVSTVGLLGLHIAAALKHHFVDRDFVLAGMLPLISPRAAQMESSE
ncbi:cytochrome b [Novosphingobium sp. BL-52-GroH]|uniref:cytochrome b n=1 Tax=Novosphingobium sp. BL-52-GroH TaxID=3349877 RepID=UPI00384F69D6